MYKIGELSKLSNIPVKTLRYYDLEGILCPDLVDAFTGYRYYSAAKLSDCYRILALKELGFTLEEIKAQSNMSKEALLTLLGEKQSELEELQVRTTQRMGQLHKIAQALQEDNHMFDIVVRKSDEIRVAYQRRIIKDKTECGDILQEICKMLPVEKIGNRRVVIDYEVEFRGESFDTGFGVEIMGRLPHTQNLEEKIIRFSQETVGLVCKEEVYEEAVLALHQYVQENHLQVIGATYKILYEDGTVEVKIPVCRLLAEKQLPRNDELSLPFENDERVIGHWKLVDYLPSREQFNPEKPKTFQDNQRIKELYFLPDGQWYWCFGWTKGYLLSSFGYPHQQGINPYTIEKIQGETYLFVEMKFEQYYQWGGKPEIWVFKKLDAKAYTREEIRKKDEIPSVPADDIRVLGKWEVCDLVKTVEAFVPGQPDDRFPHEALFWRSAEFLEGGSMYNTFRRAKDGADITDDSSIWRWVTGNVICNPQSTASMYKIRRYGEDEYIFIQWKSGDYSYGGEEPYWYVFRRE